jgi:uncharacterized membrane protein
LSKKNKKKNQNKKKSGTQKHQNKQNNPLTKAGEQARKPNKIESKKQSFALLSREFQGPVPSPDMLERYDQVCPGSAREIIDRFHKQSDHRMELEKIAVKQGSRDSLCGIIAAFILAAISIAGGTYIAINGYPLSGTFLGGGSMVTLAGVFVYGTRQRSKERMAKNLQD